MNTGGPAFPVAYGGGRIEGMTLRDYFASKALASPTCMELSKTANWDNKTRSVWSYMQADEMLKAREQ